MQSSTIPVINPISSAISDCDLLLFKMFNKRHILRGRDVMKTADLRDVTSTLRKVQSFTWVNCETNHMNCCNNITLKLNEFRT